MTEIESLINRAYRYLRSASRLLEDNDYESSVSRTYYAMCFSAQALLLSLGLSYSSHKGVISGYGEHFVKPGVFARESGRDLNLAFQKRQLGDYESRFVISREEAADLLQRGQAFVARAAEYLEHAPDSES